MYEVHAEEVEADAADVPEEEPQADVDGDGDETELDVVGVEELIVEGSPTEVAQTEHVSCPEDAEHHRCYGGDGHCHIVEETEEPRRGDGLLGEAVALGILLEVEAYAGDGKYARQLHGPPYQNLHGHERIACPRQNGGDDEHAQRDVRIEHVGAWDVLVVTAYHAPLPDGADEQNGWEDDVHQLVRRQDDADGKDDEADDE